VGCAAALWWRRFAMTDHERIMLGSFQPVRGSAGGAITRVGQMSVLKVGCLGLHGFLRANWVCAAKVAKLGDQSPALVDYTIALSIIHRAPRIRLAKLSGRPLALVDYTFALKSTSQLVDLLDYARVAKIDNRLVDLAKGDYTIALSIIHRATESDWPDLVARMLWSP
jgi:hypothetical protein